MKINVVFTLVFTLALTLSFGQVKKSTKGTFALTNATIETVTKGTVSGTLIISEGKITALGPMLQFLPAQKLLTVRECLFIRA